MKTTPFTFILSLIVTLLIPGRLRAGTLDDAPFRIVVPGAEWQVQDSVAQSIGNDVFIVASINRTNTLLKSVIIKAVLAKISESSLDAVCAGIRDSFANPAVKKISETDTTFLGYKAKTFAYLVTQGSQITYNEATIFVAGRNGWTIACVGRPEQKDQIRKIFGFYQKKAG